MDTHTTEFLRLARSGSPVYVTDVRNRYLGLPEDASFPLDLTVSMATGDLRRFNLRLPRFLAPGYPDDARGFAVEFLLAEAYNILSSLGGRAMDLAGPEDRPEIRALHDALRARFELEKPRHLRLSYGKAVNVAERMLNALLPDAPEVERRFRFTVNADPQPAVSLKPPARTRAADVFREAALDLGRKTFLGVDIGGSDIKLVLVRDGGLAHCLEYDWNPAAFTKVEQLVLPVVTLVEVMAALAGAASGPGGAPAELAPALAKGATDAAMRVALTAFYAAGGRRDFRFDAIGMCFPDVVVGDKIVGGEVYKTRGIRDALGPGYDREYANLTALDDKLRPFVNADGVVGIVNDGPMAAFTAGVENAAADPGSVADGVFAHTLGTELGTGWVDESGSIPDIPLEVYNYIIDLGSYPERAFEPDDARSLNNFNTRLPGTLQKIASQSGVFRLTLKYLADARPGLARELAEKGFVVDREAGGVVGKYVPIDPRDMRKPFLEYMMGEAENGDPTARRIFGEIGEALAVCGEEVDWILAPACRPRTLFGRMVKRATCFDLMHRGALARDPDILMVVADDAIAETPLMRALADDPEYTVAQFAQAVGAAHYANLRLRAVNP